MRKNIIMTMLIGVMTILSRKKMDLQSQLPLQVTTQIKIRFLMIQALLFWIMHSKDFIPLFLPMVKQEAGKVIQWWAMEQTRVQCRWCVRKYLKESTRAQIQTCNTKSSSACLRSTMKLYKTCWSLQIRVSPVGLKSKNIQKLVLLSKALPNMMQVHMMPSLKRQKMERNIVLSQQRR